jgi:hypothetical protein
LPFQVLQIVSRSEDQLRSLLQVNCQSFLEEPFPAQKLQPKRPIHFHNLQAFVTEKMSYQIHDDLHHEQLLPDVYLNKIMEVQSFQTSFTQ